MCRGRQKTLPYNAVKMRDCLGQYRHLDAGWRFHEAKLVSVGAKAVERTALSRQAWHAEITLVTTADCQLHSQKTVHLRAV